MAKGPHPNHTACHPGKRVMITFLNGVRVIDVFVERKKGTLFFKTLGRVSKGEIKRFAVVRDKSGVV